jgi:hypothetical protein
VDERSQPVRLHGCSRWLSGIDRSNWPETHGGTAGWQVAKRCRSGRDTAAKLLHQMQDGGKEILPLRVDKLMPGGYLHRSLIQGCVTTTEYESFYQQRCHERVVRTRARESRYPSIATLDLVWLHAFGGRSHGVTNARADHDREDAVSEVASVHWLPSDPWSLASGRLCQVFTQPG